MTYLLYYVHLINKDEQGKVMFQSPIVFHAVYFCGIEVSLPPKRIQTSGCLFFFIYELHKTNNDLILICLPTI